MLDIDIHKKFESKTQTTNIACKGTFKEGETTALFAKSGLGKTSVLRMIAGLEKPDSGAIIFNGVAWFDHVSTMSVKERPVGMVFQDFNLFKNMTVLQNLVFAADGALSEKSQNLCRDLGITEFFERYPNELSKGQQQKVAIVRSLCLDIKVLLLDEPFSALDDDSIVELIKVLDILREDLELTVILVTHRKEVILKAAQTVVMMEGGMQGSPQELIKKAF